VRIDWLAKLRHALQVWAFALVIAALHAAVVPDRPYAPHVLYSLAISTIAWAIIDLGRDFFPSARETGWPAGWQGVALVLAGTAIGYVAGSWLGTALCQAYGLFPANAPPRTTAEVRGEIVVSGLAGIVISYYFYSANKSAYLERKMGEARRLADEARLKLLETQLEPHMLFNTLANLRALIGVDPERAQSMLDHIIAYMRATLGASRASTHALQAEFDRLEDYLALMAIRMGPRLHYELELPAELAEASVPSLLLQPLVENSIKHGLEPKVEGGSVRVSARRSETGALLLEVSDTGVGSGSAAGGTGFGLKQIQERLSAVYGAAARFDFVTRPGEGARASISLPLPA
jgi:signal transduction histidine kinase